MGIHTTTSQRLHLRTGSLCIAVTLIIALAGCTATRQGASEAAGKQPAEQRIDWAKEFKLSSDASRQSHPSEPEKPAQTSPRFKALSPLDTEKVSLSFVQEDAAQVLQLLANAASLNLVLADGLNGKKITAEYLEMPVRTILDSVCHILNVVWNENNGTIYIEQSASKVFNIDFLTVIRKSDFSVGGDVLGSGSSGGATGAGTGSGPSPLSGNFKIEGNISDEAGDIYKNIDATVEKMLAGEGYFVLNRQTGTLSVQTSPRKIAAIEQYMQVLREKYRRQVLIEAKIIEVSLDEQFEMGIDWRTVGGLISHERINPASAVVNITPSVTQDESFYSMAITSKYSNITGVFKALEQYGKLSILSNPRLKAMNGQSALISVGQSVSYLRSLNRTQQGTGEDQTTQTSTEIGSVFDGVLLGVTPVIEENNIVALHVVPIKSDLVDLDTVELGSAAEPYQITLPRVNLRELSTVTRVQSGDIVLLGGLIMEFTDKDRVGLPILPDSSLFGWMFGVKKKKVRKVELVVAMQVHVIGAENRL